MNTEDLRNRNLTDAFSGYERALYTGQLNSQMTQKLHGNVWKITLKLTIENETDTFILSSGRNVYGPVMTLKVPHVTPDVFHLTQSEYDALHAQFQEFFIQTLTR